MNQPPNTDEMQGMGWHHQWDEKVLLMIQNAEHDVGQTAMHSDTTTTTE
jgi:hypothetical protein